MDSPASVATGDLLIANIAINGGSPANVSAPSGWTQILRTDNDTNVSLISYYKVAGASEPANYTWTIDTATRAEGGITQYTGVNTSNPIDVALGNFSRGKVATTSSITTSSANEEVVDSFAFDAGTSTTGYFSTPTGMTEKYDVTFPTVGPSLAADDTVQVSAGTVGSVSTTIAGNKNRNWASQAIALKRVSPTPTIADTLNLTPHHFNGISDSFSYTVPAGSNQSLIVRIANGNTSRVPTVTQNGAPVTIVQSTSCSGQGGQWYGYLLAPSSGTFSISWDATSNTEYVVYTVNGTVTSGNPIDSANCTDWLSSANVAGTTTPPSANDLLMDWVVTQSIIAGSSHGADQTEYVNLNDGATGESMYSSYINGSSTPNTAQGMSENWNPGTPGTGFQIIAIKGQ